MRPSSARILIVAFALLAVAIVWIVGFKETPAPPLTPALVQSVLDRGKRALERRDVNSIMSLFTDDAQIMGRTPSQIRPILEQTMGELGGGSLTVAMSNLQIHPASDGALVEVNLDVSQRFPTADASYYRPHLRLILKKTRLSNFLGLGWHEEWRIQQLDSDISLDLPSI